MRQIYIVNCSQVVTSDAHPEGVYSVLQGYPINYDSRDYERAEANPNGSDELALIVAQADFADRVKQLSLAHNRTAWCVTITRADGVQVARKAFGAFPDMTPEPEPETEAEIPLEDN